jgi:hypothetical protein
MPQWFETAFPYLVVGGAAVFLFWFFWELWRYLRWLQTEVVRAHKRIENMQQGYRPKPTVRVDYVAGLDLPHDLEENFSRTKAFKR